MPYIQPNLRRLLDDVYFANMAITPGEFNYVLTQLVLAFWHRNRTYTNIAAITGVLVNIKDEFTRRVVVPYEEGKRYENGDITGYGLEDSLSHWGERAVDSTQGKSKVDDGRDSAATRSHQHSCPTTSGSISIQTDDPGSADGWFGPSSITKQTDQSR